MKKHSLRKLRLWLILGPSGAFLGIYFLISFIFVNTTDQHLLTSNREIKQYHLGLYQRFINVVHQKMLFVSDKKPKPHVTHSLHESVDTNKANIVKKTSQKKY